LAGARTGQDRGGSVEETALKAGRIWGSLTRVVKVGVIKAGRVPMGVASRTQLYVQFSIGHTQRGLVTCKILVLPV